MLNLRDKVSIFQMPTFEHIAHELDIALEKDHFILKPGRFRDEGKFVIYCEKFHVRPQPLKFVVDGRLGEQKREFTVPFQKRSVDGGPKRGTLVTILDCFDTPEHRAIDHELFDLQFTKNNMALEKPTMCQVHKNGTTLNGNRYLVLKTKDVKLIPNTISFCELKTNKQVTFKLRFSGQTWYCRRCNTEHNTTCERFYARRDERAKTELETLVVSDSTLRLVDQVGLSADVVCVPGGFLGDVATAAADASPTKELVVLA